MKTIITLSGCFSCGKTMIYESLNSIGIPYVLNNVHLKLPDYFNILKLLRVDNKSDIDDCFKNFKINEPNINFLNKAIKHSRFSIITTSEFCSEDKDNYKIVNLAIFRDPRISWVVINNIKTLSEYIALYKMRFAEYINVKLQTKLIKYEVFINDYKKAIVDIFYPLRLDVLDIKLTSYRYNEYMTNFDVNIANYVLNNHRDELVNEFRYIENRLKDEIKYLGYPKTLDLDSII